MECYLEFQKILKIDTAADVPVVVMFILHAG